MAGAVFALLVCEGALRRFAPVGDPFITHSPNLALVLHPNLKVMPNMVSPSRFTTDEYGFRVSHQIRYDAKPSGVFRVFLIGGSTTENLFIDDARTFGAILERRLNGVLRSQGRRAEVINAARSGTSSPDHFYLAWRVTAYQPDAIVYMMGGNDMSAYIRNGFSPEATELKALIRSRLFTSQLMRRGYFLFREVTAGGREVVDELAAGLVVEREERQRAPVKPMPEEAKRVPEFYRQNVRQILALHRRQRLPAVFMTVPVLWHAEMAPELDARLTGTYDDGGGVRYPTEELEQVMDAYNDVLRTEAAAEPLAHLVDLARLLPKDGAFFIDQGHFTDPAQQRIAEILFAGLVRSGLLP